MRGDGGDGQVQEFAWNQRLHFGKGNAGIQAGKKENKLGLRASDTSEVIFSDCRVPAENLLGARR